MKSYPKTFFFLLFFFSAIITFAQNGPSGNILLSTSSAVAAPGDTVCIDIFGANIGNVEGMQFSLNWDTAAFRFVRVDDFSLPEMSENDFGVNFVDGGNVSFLYLLPPGETMPNDTRLFSLCLEAVGEVGDFSQISFNNFPTPIELAGDVNGVTTVFPYYGLGNGLAQITADGTGSPLSVAIVENGLTSCTNGAGARIVVEASGGTAPYNYVWLNSTGIVVGNSETLETDVPGSYDLLVTDAAGITLISVFNVVVSDLALGTPDVTDAACPEGSDGRIELNVSDGIGNYSFAWSNGADSSVVEGLAPGDYEVTVTDQGGCGLMLTVTVGAGESDLDVTDVVIVDASCSGASDGSIDPTVAGGSGSYSYQWSNGATTATVTGLSAGEYTLTVTDALGCAVERQYTVGARETDLEVSNAVIGDVSCTGATDGSIALTVLGGFGNYTYNWSNGATTATISGLSVGDYAVTITDAVGCDIQEQYTVAAGAGVEFQAIVSAPICGAANGSISLSLDQADDAYTFNWSNGAMTRDLTSIGPGVYSVTVTETASGCTASETFDLSWEPLVATPQTQCLYTISGAVQSFAGASVTGGAGPYIFSWDTGLIDTADTESLVPVSGQGSYGVTITDAENCQVTQVVEVPNCGRDNDPALTLSLQPATVTAGEIVCMDLQVAGFTNVQDLRFSIGWNPLELEFVDALGEAIGSSDFRLIPGTGDGTVAFDLADGLDPITLVDGRTLIQLCFRAVGMSGETTVRFGDSPRQRLAYNDKGEVFGMRTNNAAITIDARPGTPGISIGSADDVFPGDAVCIPLTIDSFSNVDSMRFRLTWDADLLQFDSVTALGFPALETAEFNLDNVASGRLGFNWGSGEDPGISQVEEAVLFSLCFTAIGDPGVSPVTFASAPGTVEVFSGGELLPVRLSDGQVSVSDFVWPGDADLSGSVNHFDLLPLGLTYGRQGPGRNPAMMEWMGQRGPNWPGMIPGSNANAKHADTNGDGRVAATDTMAVVRNWGQSVPGSGGSGPALSPDNGGPALFVEPAVVGTGSTVAFNITLGAPGDAAEDIYGLAFSIVYDPLAIDPSSVGIDFSGSWLGAIPNSLLALAGNDAAGNRIDLALTRIDQRERSGTGVIARLVALTSDTIPGGGDSYELPFRIENVRMLDAAGNLKPVQPQPTSATLELASSINDPAIARRISVFPNPASNTVRIVGDGLDVERVDLLMPDGRSAGNWSRPATLEVGHLPGGTYWLRIITGEGIAVKPLVIIR